MGIVILNIVLLVLFIILFNVARKHWRYTDLDDVFFALSIIAIISLVVVCGVTSVFTINKDARFEAYQQKYESLVSQAENNLYISPLSKAPLRKLAKEIEHWNCDLAFRQSASKNFWINWFYPGDYDRLEYIDYNLLGSED